MDTTDTLLTVLVFIGAIYIAAFIVEKLWEIVRKKKERGGRKENDET